MQSRDNDQHVLGFHQISVARAHYEQGVPARSLEAESTPVPLEVDLRLDPFGQIVVVCPSQFSFREGRGRFGEPGRPVKLRGACHTSDAWGGGRRDRSTRKDAQ